MEPATLPLIVVALLSVSSLAAAGTVGMKVEDICGRLKHPALCVSSIKNSARGIDSMDLHAALKHELQAANARFLAMVSTAEGIRDPDTALRLCMVGLNDAKDDMAQALAGVEDDDVGTTSSNLDSFADNINYCRDDDSETPLKPDADVVADLIDNCWALIDTIWPKGDGAAASDVV